MKIFLDTNVLIDFMGERPAYYMQAATIFSLGIDHRCEVAVSALSMVTANYICCERGTLSQADWRRKVNVMSEFVAVCSVDAVDIFSSCNSLWDDYEDCVQFQVAKRNGCDIIVTRNVRDFAHSDIPVMTPDEVINSLNGQ